MNLEQKNNEKYEEQLFKENKRKLRVRLNKLKIMFFSIQNQKVSELITNWIMLLSFLLLVIFFSISNKYVLDLNGNYKKQVEEQAFNNFMALLSLLLLLSSFVYKVILRLKKKKRIYWTKRDAEKRGWFNE